MCNNGKGLVQLFPMHTEAYVPDLTTSTMEDNNPGQTILEQERLLPIDTVLSRVHIAHSNLVSAGLGLWESFISK